jgi:hypothetical protein
MLRSQVCSTSQKPAPRRRPASGSLPLPRGKSDVCRVGEVRRSFPIKGWSARFQFRQQGKLIAIEGPRRTLRDRAEEDRKFVSAYLDQAPRSSKVDAATCAIKDLRDRGATSLKGVPGSARTATEVGVPGSASTATDVGVPGISNMKFQQLRTLATQTPGIMEKKKTRNGKWMHKTCKELRAELLAITCSDSIKAEVPVSDSIGT